MQGSDEPSVWVAEVVKGTAIEQMNDILAEARTVGAEVLVADADMVFGRDHVKSALYHASKAVLEKRNSADSLVMETLLYMSGQRQLSAAIAKMSVHKGSTRIMVAQLSGPPITSGDGWTPMVPYEKGVSLDRLLSFGISQREIATMEGKEPIELVMEKVAAVDLLKK